MQTSAELKNLLQRIDHKGYPAYEDTRGSYEFPGYVLSIDHVQGDPFAAPSKVQRLMWGNSKVIPISLSGKTMVKDRCADYLLSRLKFAANIISREKFPLVRRFSDTLWRLCHLDRKC